MPRSREIYIYLIVVKFDRRLDSTAAEVPVKFQSDTVIYTTNLTSLNFSRSCINYMMMTSSNGNTSALLALCAGNSPVTGEFPSQRQVTRSIDVFFALRRNKRLSK